MISDRDTLFKDLYVYADRENHDHRGLRMPPLEHGVNHLLLGQCVGDLPSGCIHLLGAGPPDNARLAKLPSIRVFRGSGF